MSRRIVFGAIAAACAAMVALDAAIGAPMKYPLWHKLFDGEWDVFRNVAYGFCSVAAAFFGYLALNVKNGASHG